MTDHGRENQMARLIIVHQSNGGKEVLVNVDKIVWAYRTTTAAGSSTSLKMTGDKSFSIIETLEELIALSEAL
jgi:hypothetical protein